MAPQLGTVYVLCIRPAYFHAAHYIGWTADPDPVRRVAEHLAGSGSPLIRAAVAASRVIDLVLAVPGDRRLERKWHNAHGPRVCPRCRRQRPPRPRQLRLPNIHTGGRRQRAASPTPLWRLTHALAALLAFVRQAYRAEHARLVEHHRNPHLDHACTSPQYEVQVQCHPKHQVEELATGRART
jgi:hypothetical protein